MSRLYFLSNCGDQDKEEQGHIKYFFRIKELNPFTPPKYNLPPADLK